MRKKQKEVWDIQQRTQRIDRLNKGQLKGPGGPPRETRHTGREWFASEGTHAERWDGKVSPDLPSVTKGSGSRLVQVELVVSRSVPAQMIGDQERLLSKPQGWRETRV